MEEEVAIMAAIVPVATEEVAPLIAEERDVISPREWT
jgi:hypothetical protein